MDRFVDLQSLGLLMITIHGAHLYLTSEMNISFLFGVVLFHSLPNLDLLLLDPAVSGAQLLWIL